MSGRKSNALRPVGFFDERARNSAIESIGNILCGRRRDDPADFRLLTEEPYDTLEAAKRLAEDSRTPYEFTFAYKGREVRITGSGDTKDDERSQTVLRNIGIEVVEERRIRYSWDIEVGTDARGVEGDYV